MSLQPPMKVQKLQATLNAKAKEAPNYRFYVLYDKVYREDILAHAYDRCRVNRGAPGVDGQRFQDIEKYGRERWLGELAEELREKQYSPQAVRRTYILKANGNRRALGIPTIKDRTVQMAVALVLGPIFEADLGQEQHAYRPERKAQGAVRQVHRLLNTGHTEVLDGDLSSYFDTIPHAELMKSLSRRISDRHMLRLLKRWLQAPVEEEDDRGRKHRTTHNKDKGRGTPQGSPISPLLSNVYMRRFILSWKVLGGEQHWDAHIVNYADDFVICCRGSAQEALEMVRSIMGKLKLSLNEDKTHVCRVPEESFDFLGYTIGRCYATKTGRAYIGTRPSRKAIRRICREISERTESRWTWREAGDVVRELNWKLNGWANYFYLGSVSKAYRAIEEHARHRLRQWLRRKHKLQAGVYSRFPDEYLHETLGLVRLRERTRSFPWAKA